MAGISDRNPAGPDPRHPMRVRAEWQIMAFIREARIHHGQSQRALAQHINRAQPTYAGWENGGQPQPDRLNVHQPRLESVLDLLDVLGYDLVIRPRFYAGPARVPAHRDEQPPWAEGDDGGPGLLTIKPTPPPAVVDVCMFCGRDDCAHDCAGWKAAIERGDFG